MQYTFLKIEKLLSKGHIILTSAQIYLYIVKNKFNMQLET